MLKFKSPITKLSAAIGFMLFAGNVVADIPIYSTYKYPEVAGDPLGLGDWAAGYFFVNSVVCPYGCNITGVSLLLAGDAFSKTEAIPFNATLAVVDDASFYPGNNQKFQLALPNPAEGVVFNNSNYAGHLGTIVQFTPDPATSAQVQSNMGYWLKLTNIGLSPSIGWYYDEANKSGEYWADSQYGFGAGSPFIFEVRGVALPAPPLTQTPIPGAAWMMSSALIGMLVAGRRNRL